MLAHPLIAVDILKRRLIEIGIVTSNESIYDRHVALDILRSLMRKLDREMRFYYEVNFGEHTMWRIGNFFLFNLI